ncbi:hypothetical protein RvY_12162 [Ramazzottius varieornatus]|uniref:Uncharacterized protein n=1 Tax=Ramazzottius varieornatus TaxID=947166 RepID=A0A1D1VIK9_RAMVA|nr:hypothetical protein RvY_12162 [Ramazzottius varieornatus]
MEMFSSLFFLTSLFLFSNAETFRNPIKDGDAPDPWILRYNGAYLLSHTGYDEVVVYQSDRADNWRGAASVTAWRPLPAFNDFTEVWAPEIHFIRGNLYIYFTANPHSNYSFSSNGHRMFALQADDPSNPLGTWTFRGRIFDPRKDIWAIDGTILQHQSGKLYFIWVGGFEFDGLTTYISEMGDPLTVVPGSTILLNRATLPWETQDGNVSEGPAVIDSGDNYYVVYSGTSTWSDNYNLGMLRINKTKDPMVIGNWYKNPEPVFVKNVTEGVYGPGHASFTVSPDGTEHWMVYHAMNKTYADGNWRQARIQKMSVDSQGVPVFPEAVGFNRELEVPSGSPKMFRNPILDRDAPDPWILRYNNTYLMTFTMHDCIVIYQSDKLEDWRNATTATIYTPPPNMYYELWAPEIHLIRGNLYIYYTATTNRSGTEGHRMYVLRCNDARNPLGNWTFEGKILDPICDWWAIDGTVLQHVNGKMYFIWAGRWEYADWTTDHLLQLLIAEMSDPLTIIRGSTRLLNRPALDWEMHGDEVHYGVSEGPAVIETENYYHVPYSGSSTWTNNYALGMLTINKSADPMIATNWNKAQRPVFVTNEAESVFGPGHASFTVSPDGTEHWMVYHAMDRMYQEGNERYPRIQRFTIGKDEFPVFPSQAAGFARDLAVPSNSSRDSTSTSATMTTVTLPSVAPPSSTRFPTSQTPLAVTSTPRPSNQETTTPIATSTPTSSSSRSTTPSFATCSTGGIILLFSSITLLWVS